MSNAKLAALLRRYDAATQKMQYYGMQYEEERVRYHNAILDALDALGVYYSDRWDAISTARRLA